MENLPQAIEAYNHTQISEDRKICEILAKAITSSLPEAAGKLWHGHPVWFINDNPIVGYSKEKKGLRLMFWSGADFNEDILNIKGQKFKDASVFYNSENEINMADLKRCMIKARDIQWDYKNIVKRKGKLERLK